jgi:apolipoprotein N-acyltransferase
MRSIATLLFFLLSGVLLALSLPPFPGGAYTILPALVFLLLGARREKRVVFVLAQAMLTCIVTGLIHLWGGYTSTRFFYAFTPFLFLGMAFSGVAIITSILSRLFPFGGKFWVLGIAAGGVVAEWLTTFTPLPVSIAITLSQSPILLQPAALGGIYLLSFLLWVLAAHLAHLTYSLYKTRQIRNGAHHIVLLDAILLLLLGTNLWSRLSLGSTRPTVVVAAVQDFNGVEAQTYTNKPVPENLPEWDALARQTMQATPSPALIVCPEEGLGTYFRPNDPSIPANQLARALKTQLIVGFEEAGGAERPFNSAALISPEGTTQTIHHKIKPFLGEAIAKGESVTVDAKTGIGMLICFDTCWPDTVRQVAQDGGNLLAVPNYDPPTPNGVLTHLHAALMPIRAVENSLPIIRADANGKSMVVDGDGTIRAVAGMWESGVAIAPVTPRTRATLYTLLGDWVVWFSLAALAFLAGVGVRKFLAKQRD